MSSNGSCDVPPHRASRSSVSCCCWCGVSRLQVLSGFSARLRFISACDGVHNATFRPASDDFLPGAVHLGDFRAAIRKNGQIRCLACCCICHAGVAARSAKRRHAAHWCIDFDLTSVTDLCRSLCVKRQGGAPQRRTARPLLITDETRLLIRLKFTRTLPFMAQTRVPPK